MFNIAVIINSRASTKYFTSTNKIFTQYKYLKTKLNQLFTKLLPEKFQKYLQHFKEFLQDRCIEERVYVNAFTKYISYYLSLTVNYAFHSSTNQRD